MKFSKKSKTNICRNQNYKGGFISSSLVKLETASQEIIKSLSPNILKFDIDEKLGRLKVLFKDESTLYIYYNNYEEYSYQLIFSSNPLDRIRFDSMDKNWEVETNPHHFHPRFIKEGFKSPMCGNPSKDMLILCNLVKDGKLKSKAFRFDR